VIGLVMSVLVVANVVSGAVVAGTRRIGVLKSIGFSPGQVAASYLLQVAVPALADCAAGVVAGNLLSVPLLSQTAQMYGVGTLAVPVWWMWRCRRPCWAWPAWPRCCWRCARDG
jgi:putative ABC transport system permease protein